MCHVPWYQVAGIYAFFFFFSRLSDTQECLESSLIEKENTLAKTSEKLELISSLRESLSEKEIQNKELSDRLLQTEHSVSVIAPFFLNLTLERSVTSTELYRGQI